MRRKGMNEGMNEKIQEQIQKEVQKIIHKIENYGELLKPGSNSGQKVLTINDIFYVTYDPQTTCIKAYVRINTGINEKQGNHVYVWHESTYSEYNCKTGTLSKYEVLLEDVRQYISEYLKKNPTETKKPTEEIRMQHIMMKPFHSQTRTIKTTQEKDEILPWLRKINKHISQKVATTGKHLIEILKQKNTFTGYEAGTHLARSKKEYEEEQYRESLEERFENKELQIYTAGDPKRKVDGHFWRHSQNRTTKRKKMGAGFYEEIFNELDLKKNQHDYLHDFCTKIISDPKKLGSKERRKKILLMYRMIQHEKTFENRDHITIENIKKNLEKIYCQMRKNVSYPKTVDAGKYREYISFVNETNGYLMGQLIDHVSTVLKINVPYKHNDHIIVGFSIDVGKWILSGEELSNHYILNVSSEGIYYHDNASQSNTTKLRLALAKQRCEAKGFKPIKILISLPNIRRIIVKNDTYEALKSTHSILDKTIQDSAKTYADIDTSMLKNTEKITGENKV